MNKIIIVVALISLLHSPAQAKESKSNKDGDDDNQFLRYRRRDFVQYENINAALGLDINDIIKPKILGGGSAADNEFPAFVDLKLGCGGSLISPNAVLTAAHCLGAQWSPYVSIGAIERGTGIQSEIVSVGIHPLWDESENNYDFAILRLKDDVTVTPNTLNRDVNKPSDGDALTVIGLGTTSLYGGEAKTLQKVTVPYVESCSSIYEGIFKFDSTSMLCAGGKRKDSCQGDSGGPLMDEKTGDQVGVVSFGIGCGEPGYPGIYSRVASAIDWIDDQLCLYASDAEITNADFPIDCTQKLRQPVTFEIKYDSYIGQTSWNLKNVNDGMLFINVPPTGIESTDSIKSIKLNLQPGSYEFEINDTAGNGICCKYGQGEYKIKGQANTIERSGSFTTNDIVKFVVDIDGFIIENDVVQPENDDADKPQEINKDRSKKDRSSKGSKGNKGNKRAQRQKFRMKGG